MKLNIDICIGCGVCTQTCRYSVFSLDCKTTMGIKRCISEISNPGNCVNCGRCIEECLVGALTL